MSDHPLSPLLLLLLQIDAPKGELVPIRMGTSGDLKVRWRFCVVWCGCQSSPVNVCSLFSSRKMWSYTYAVRY
jgi:hypothetical protein